MYDGEELLGHRYLEEKAFTIIKPENILQRNSRGDVKGEVVKMLMKP